MRIRFDRGPSTFVRSRSRNGLPGRPSCRGAWLQAGIIAAAVLAANPAFGAISISHDTSVIPDRALEAITMDPLGFITLGPGESPMNVGVRVDLSLVAPAGATVENIQWTIPGSIIRDYDIVSERNFREGFLSTCSTESVGGSDLQQTSVSYYYTDPGVSTVTVSALVDGNPESASMTFRVVRNPKAEIFYASGPGVAVNEDVDSSGTVDYTDFLLFPDAFGKDVDPAGSIYGLIGEHRFWHEIAADLFFAGFGLCSSTPTLCLADPDCPSGETCELFGTSEDGGEFFRFHRGFIQKADCWRGIFGYPCVKVYASAPNYVPTGNDVDHYGLCSTAATPCEEDTDCPAGETCEARVGTGVIDRGRQTDVHGSIQELPEQFTLAGDGSTKLADYTNEDELAHDILPYHDTMHGRLCNSGDFTFSQTTPGDPIFWRFHFMLTRVFTLWQYLKLDDGTHSIPPVECAGPGGTPVFFPDPDLAGAPTCSGGVTDPCSTPSGSLFSLGVSPVSCTVRDVMMEDATFPSDPSLNQGTTQGISFDVEVEDTLPPEVTCPADLTIQCDQPLDPTSTGTAAATDLCDGTATASPSDAVAPGSCPDEFDLTRTWSAMDASGNSDACDQTIHVVDTVGPAIQCNAPATIVPPDAPTSFTATAMDNCDPSVSVTISGFDCFKFTKKGKRVDKTGSCIVQIAGNTISILDSGGVGDNINWTVHATDRCGNMSEETCELKVINPGKGKGKGKGLVESRWKRRGKAGRRNN